MNGANMVHEESSSRTVSAEQFDSQFFHQPTMNGHASNIATSHLPPVHRDAQPSVKPYGSSRMAFVRRSKRGELVLSRSRRGIRGDIDGSRSGDDGIKSGSQDESTVVDALHTNGITDYQSDSSTKKRSIRIEHASWVRTKFNLDESDSLLDSCSAALVRKIMLQGRLHITSSSLCFYAKIFGSVTKEKWPFSSIQSVRKRRGGFMANSIKISFLNPQAPSVIIASLNRREAILAIIASRLSVLSPSSGEMTSRTGSGEGDSEDHSDGVFHTDGSIPIEPKQINQSNGSTPMTSDVASRNSFDDQPMGRSDISVENGGELLPDDPNSEESAFVDNLVWHRSGEPMGEIKGKEWAKRIEQVRDVLRVPVVIAFNTLFLDDWMISNYLPACNNFDVQSSDWHKDEEDGSMRRDVSFRRPLRYRIGPKETRCEEIQRYCFTHNGGVLIEVENVSLDAPFGDYFRVESYYELLPSRNGSETELIASLAVHFSKSTMLRSKIENGALAETKSTFLKLVEMGKEHIEANVPKNKIVAALKKHVVASNGKLGVQSLGRMPSVVEGDVDGADGNDELLGRNPVATKVRTASFESRNIEHDNNTFSEGRTSTSSLRDSRNMNMSGVADVDFVRPYVGATVVEMNDVFSMKILRGVAVGSLFLVTILLVFVLISFRRMKDEFRVLQAIVGDLQRFSVNRVTNTCDGT